MKKKYFEQKVPDSVVYSAGNQYQSAAFILSNTNGNFYAGAINASLAIEIYLKAFLVTDHAVGGYRRHKKTKRGHDLLKLYKDIHPTDQFALKEAIKGFKPEFDLEAQLSRYRKVFMEARYMFEPVMVESIGSGIIVLSEVLKKAISIIIQSRYPVTTPAHLQKRVDLMLGKK